MKIILENSVDIENIQINTQITLLDDFQMNLTMAEKLFAERKELKDGFIELVESINPTHWSTHIFNFEKMSKDTLKRYRTGKRSSEIEIAIRMQKEFLAKMEQRIFGKYFYQKPGEERILSISFPQHINSNLHYHSFLSVPKPTLIRFNFRARPSFLERDWQKICSAGTFEINKLETPEDLLATSIYSLKENFKEVNYQNCIFSSQFWNHAVKRKSA